MGKPTTETRRHGEEPIVFVYRFKVSLCSFVSFVVQSWFFSVSPWWMLVLNAYKKKSAGGGGGCGGGAVAQFKNASNVWDGEAAFADHEKCSNQIADHVVKKSVAADGVNQFVALALPLGMKDGADVVRFRVRLKLGLVDFKC